MEGSLLVLIAACTVAMDVLLAIKVEEQIELARSVVGGYTPAVGVGKDFFIILLSGLFVFGVWSVLIHFFLEGLDSPQHQMTKQLKKLQLSQQQKKAQLDKTLTQLSKVESEVAHLKERIHVTWEKVLILMRAYLKGYYDYLLTASPSLISQHDAAFNQFIELKKQELS